MGKTRDTLNKAEDQILLHLSTISKLTKKSSTQSEKIDNYKTQIETLLSNKLELENSNSDLMVNKSQLELLVIRGSSRLELIKIAVILGTTHTIIMATTIIEVLISVAG